MFYRHGGFEDSYDRLAEKIKKELMDTLQRKGVIISKIKVDMNVNADMGKMDLHMNLNTKNR